MSRTKKITVLLGSTALALSLTACGGGDEYCDLIEEYEANASSMEDMADQDAAVDMAEETRAIADAAPDDIAEDWNTVADAMDKLANFDPEDADMEDPDSMGPLENLDELEQAGTNVEEHVQDNCDVSLN
ncbi:hypothetical protein [Phytoactinopolyspora halophila]|uniref:Uncharacterized protein n=1 Tax=Phytoactinopolyspora halophila TaxID=1981511 RepID=A0A329R517_9ACTN|nr:hypothetical protein [Phytoactinopolyspora halophila]RAW18622.1 hypothetical protein DPM12_00610 [Phytoactinopolyspora halophila]